MTRTSKQSGNTAASAHQHHQQQDAIGTTEEATNMNHARQEQVASGGGVQMPRPQLEEALKCPRCDSSNTKFCYYNNYSMSQPRYFCKACRRYWTQGGSLRNVPVGGGGCRKNKRSSSSAVASPSSTSTTTRVINNNLAMLLPASTSFPNVLPTFMSTGFEFSLPLAPPLSLPSNLEPAPAVAPGDASMTTPSFLDLLRGGFLDHQGNGGTYGSTPSGGNGMEMPLPPLYGFGVMQHGVVGDHHGAAQISGADATTATYLRGHHQWVGTSHGHNTSYASAAGGLQQVGTDQQQKGVLTNRDNADQSH